MKNKDLHLDFTLHPRSSKLPKPFCFDCCAGKMTQFIGKDPRTRATRPGQLIHTDICIMPEQSVEGYTSFCTFIDDYSSHTSVQFLFARSEIRGKFEEYNSMLIAKFGQSCEILQSDNEYCASELKQYCLDNGIHHRHSLPYQSNQNGVPERKNRTLNNAGRTLLIEASFDRDLWNHAISTACYVQNRILNVSTIGGITPFEAWEGRKPSVKNLRIFGSSAMVYISSKRPGQDKLSTRSELCHFIGYARDHKAWLFIQADGRVVASNNAVFDERKIMQQRIDAANSYPPTEPASRTDTEILPSTGRNDTAPSPSESRIDTDTFPSAVRNDTAPYPSESRIDTDTFPSAVRNDTAPYPSASRIDTVTLPSAGRHDTDPSPSDSRTDTDTIHSAGRIDTDPLPSVGRTDTDIPSASRTGPETYYPNIPTRDNYEPEPEDMSDFVLPDQPRRNPKRNGRMTDFENQDDRCLDAFISQTVNSLSAIDELPIHDNINSAIDEILKFAMIAEDAKDPKNHFEALSGPHAKEWHAAMSEEYQSLMDKGTYGNLVPLPAGAKAIDNTWVLKIKRDVDGNPYKFKARNCLRGDRQRPGIDFNETFAPVASFSTIRMLLTLAAAQDKDLIQYDVKTAYLHGDIDIEGLYAKQPKGFEVPGKENWVYELLKSQYGLRQAGLIWHGKVVSIFVASGLTQSQRDPCLFYKITDTEQTILAIVVDDILGVSTDKDKYARFVKAANIEMIELEAKQYLAMHIERDRSKREITLHQGAYIDQILEKFKMTDCKPVSTPIAPKSCLSKSMSPETEEERKQMLSIPYRGAVGSLMYVAVSTRPDISKAVSNVSRFLDTPGLQHWQAVKRIFRYLKGTRDIKLVLGGTAPLQLNAYSDADWGGDIDTRRSTTGFVVLLGTSLICWKSRLQTVVSLSTVEAEYYAITDATRDLLYMLPIAHDMQLPQNLPLIVNEDNQGCQAVAEKAINNQRSKHIDIKYHWIKERINDGIIKIKYCPTDRMIADILTKGLEEVKHRKNTYLLGLKPTIESDKRQMSEDQTKRKTTLSRGSVDIKRLKSCLAPRSSYVRESAIASGSFDASRRS
jgi:hypothetical protein